MVASVPRGSLAGGMQRREKRDQGRSFRRAQAVSICRHVAAALQYLADQLVLSETRGDGIERRSSLAAFSPSAWQLRHCFPWNTSAP